MHRCERDAADVNDCLRYAANKLASFIRRGIPEIGIVDVSIGFDFGQVHRERDRGKRSRKGRKRVHE